ncbi:MFS transporter [Vibrio aquimaris]|uniref:Major Facilitator Superfamily protein n=1 Tax=Vibrio aquimaris TaxID=2587862 RepID=A0A5P9CRE3_9VIBR|nr:MFS transporter [Vibrio aquimaris]QFT28543.1 Major Facilitator Superfamily protein [Vibrio aquimaris]
MSNSSISYLCRMCLLLGSSLLVMANAAIAPSLTELNRVFDDPFGVSLIMTLPAIAVIVCAPFVSRLIHLLGDKTSLLLGLAIYGLLGSTGLWVDSLQALLIGRFVFGISIVMCMTVINHLIAHYFTGKERLHFISQQAIAVNLGGIVFVMFSGWLSSIHWRLPFAIYLIALFTLAISIKGIVSTDKSADSSTHSIRFSDIKPVLAFYLIGWLGMLCYYLILLCLPYLLTQSQGLTTTEVGIAMGVMSILSAIVAYYTRFGVHLYGERNIMMLCLVSFAFAFLCLSQNQVDWRAYPAIVFTGIGFGCLLPVLTHLVICISTARHRTQMLSGFVMFYFLGQAMSSFVLDFRNILGGEYFYHVIAVLLCLASILSLKFVPDLRETASKVVV